MDNFAQRLLSARKMAGLSLQDLADKMEIEITKQALGQYEKGQINPSSPAMIALSKALNVPVDYFFRKSDVRLENLEFRKMKSISSKEIEAIKYKALHYLEKYREVEDILNIDNNFKNPLSNNLVTCEDDIERCADELRTKWDLGLDPIKDVIALLEDNRIKVFEIDAPDEFSGLSSLTGDIAVIVVNRKINLVRKRLTALHELAHLMLVFPDDMSEKEKEHFCFSLAAAILFPGKAFIEKLGVKRRGILIEELILLENDYGISVQAIVWRAKSLQLISETKFRDFHIWLNKTNNKKTEFGQFRGREIPVRFKRLVYRALSEDIITGSKAAALLDMTLSKLEQELGQFI